MTGSIETAKANECAGIGAVGRARASGQFFPSARPAAV